VDPDAAQRGGVRAGANKYGFAYLIPKNLEKALTTTRDQADVMILTLHSGVEYEPEPPPDDGVKAGGPGHDIEVSFNNEPTLGQRELRRLAIDLGADIVVNHHPHVLQGFEAYNGKIIAHSLGNFIMDLSYIETFPTLVLTLEIDTGGICGYRIVPAWMDAFVTQPATGQLGRAILERIAEYSRTMDVVVDLDSETVSARLYPASDAPAAQVETFVQTVSLRLEDGYAISEPLPLDEPGCLSRIVKVRGDGLASYEICWGAEILWHGGFEAEGATLWDDNTSDEWLDESEFRTGKRSLALRRQTGQGEVGTDLEKHLPCDPTRRHSMVGYLKGDNAAEANILGRFYSDRSSGSVLNDTQIGPAYTGNSDWFGQWQNLVTPSNGRYFEMRCTMESPASGEALAWFDDLAFIEWLPWQTGVAGLAVDHPSNTRYLQVRTTDLSVMEVEITYEMTSFGSGLSSTPGEGTAPGSSPAGRQGWLGQNYPNPFNPSTRIELAAPTTGEGSTVATSLAIYDTRGRRLATLFHGALLRGETRIFVWDGKDDAGRSLPSGIYFARAEIVGRVENRKMVLVR